MKKQHDLYSKMTDPFKLKQNLGNFRYEIILKLLKVIYLIL